MKAITGKLTYKDELTCKVQELLKEEVEWLPELKELHSTKLAEANCCTDAFSKIEHSEGSPEAVEISSPNLQSTHQKQLSDVKSEFFSRYKKGKLLGKGGFGSVYSGLRIADKKKVAIKYVIKGDKFETITIPGEKQDLPLEVALMKMESKPPHCSNVLQLLEWFDVGDVIILVLERPNPCMDLLKFAKLQKGGLSEAQTREIMVQVVRAARHCCDRGVLHRDIKPENLLINPDTMEVKLIDFGCGALMQDEPYKYYSGTRTYIPPEFTVIREYTGIPATIWGLGILMVKLLCGNCPFRSLQDLQEGHLKLSSNLSRECFELIMWCLELTPETRPTFDDLARHEWFTGDRFRTCHHHSSEHLHWPN
ncbi:serine/threonine-protein kinase pim-1-like [Hemibagrus wyckioides]|uniref:serine/threonine-protein kinase pim-1-like n=1 Tax=Hemibagrus wyckioides TaxID=337641 RepID=UPI00266DA8A0|nr:serine/threonine-protein kinase pim-1-like [Hemibagrus wyckioides]